MTKTVTLIVPTKKEKYSNSIALIRAETKRYDIVRFSKVTTKSLVAGTGC